jgi:hypothetical protein
MFYREYGPSKPIANILLALNLNNFTRPLSSDNFRPEMKPKENFGLI